MCFDSPFESGLRQVCIWYRIGQSSEGSTVSSLICDRPCSASDIATVWRYINSIIIIIISLVHSQQSIYCDVRHMGPCTICGHSVHNGANTRSFTWIVWKGKLIPLSCVIAAHAATITHRLQQRFGYASTAVRLLITYATQGHSDVIHQRPRTR